MFTATSISQKYVKRYPNSKRTNSWKNLLVHIETENGVWRCGGQGYTYSGKKDAWILKFEDAVKEISHCGPEKQGNFLLVDLRDYQNVGGV